MAEARRGLRIAMACLLASCFLVGLVCFVSKQWSLAVAQNAAPGRKTPIAIVEGAALYEKDLPPRVLGHLQQLRQQDYTVRRGAVEALVNQRLVESAATRQGLSVEEVMKREPDQGAFLRHLRLGAQISILLTAPRVRVAQDASRLRGNPQAPVTITEFADFSCPFCRQMEPTLKELLNKYSGKVKLSYRDFPMQQIHPGADLAAKASRCAGEQNKFWEYHDLLFSNTSEFSSQYLVENAKQLKLDEIRFSSCLNSGRYDAQIDRDAEDGIRAGTSGTPSFFINGIFLGGAQPAEAFERIIDEELQSANRESAQR